MTTQMLISPRSYQSGLTLIELLVAMVLGLLIALAASAALLVSRQGFFAVDAASQLRDNARYAQDVIQRLGVQAGYKNIFFMKGGAGTASGIDPNPPPHVFGVNNANRTSTTTWDAGTAWGVNDAGKNSDILVLRAQTSTYTETSTTPDGTMIDCMGIAPTAIPTSQDDRFVSILHVRTSSDGEPSLVCSRSATGAAPYDVQPLVQGVENFQVLYGVDGIAPSNTTVPIPSSTYDSIPERYLRADQLTVSGNEAATYANWQRVRSIRIGMVLRGPVGSALSSTTQSIHSFGNAAFDSSADVGSAYTTSDSRLRQTVTYTIQLRNCQNQGYQPASSTTPCDVVMPS